MDKILDYIRENPVTFQEFRQSLNPKGESFILLVGESPAVEYAVIDDDDIAREKILATVIVYDFQEKTLEEFSRTSLIYNENEDTQKIYDTVATSGNIEFNSALNRLEKNLEKKEWIPSAKHLSRVVGRKLSDGGLYQLGYPNKISVEIFQKLK